MPSSKRPPFSVALLEIENATTGLPIGKTAKSVAQKLLASSLLDNGIQVLLPKGSCAQGHIVSMSLAVEIQGKAEKVLATGQIVKADPRDDGMLVNIDFKKMDRKLWQTLIESVEHQQSRILEIFESIKGDDNE
ncbi:MAG TPA: hypothetical protein DCL41_06170 [Bdellovibrionales bacterium]|nr:hypothetical protein [Pseudobdellovibrionaceae bacterium]HAG91435.1 hypothetical protein [Bdellovibrionales bacterium]